MYEYTHEIVDFTVRRNFVPFLREKIVISTDLSNKDFVSANTSVADSLPISHLLNHIV